MKIFPRIARGVAVAATSLFCAQTFALTIVLTNDDGWDSPGIQAMKDALASAGHTVYLVASLTEQSGSSGAVNFEPLQVVKQQSTAGVLEYSVALSSGLEGAEPATCAAVGIGIAQTASGSSPDLVVSGINAGQNLGAAALMSGTVGAATTAMSTAIGGAQLPAIAISTDELCTEDSAACHTRNTEQYRRVAQWMVAFVEELENRTKKQDSMMPPGFGVNINFPPLESPVGASVTRQGRTFSIGGQATTLNFGCYGDCVNAPTGAAVPAGITGSEAVTSTELKDTDTLKNAAGYITLVPIYGDFTANKPSYPKDAERLRKDLKKTLKAIGY